MTGSGIDQRHSTQGASASGHTSTEVTATSDMNRGPRAKQQCGDVARPRRAASPAHTEPPHAEERDARGRSSTRGVGRPRPAPRRRQSPVEGAHREQVPIGLVLQLARARRVGSHMCRAAAEEGPRVRREVELRVRARRDHPTAGRQCGQEQRPQPRRAGATTSRSAGSAVEDASVRRDGGSLGPRGGREHRCAAPRGWGVTHAARSTITAFQLTTSRSPGTRMTHCAHHGW